MDSRPFVFYSPGEFPEKINVTEFVDAMAHGISRKYTTKDVPPDQVDKIVEGYHWTTQRVSRKSNNLMEIGQ